ncbi:MAG: hypothetical protein J1F64_01430 [Oscillospiraceae bacterium]|nr:hypothetical protein [Oscillospiraceae bacterium]
MKNCGKCGSMMESNDVYCPKCGFKNVGATGQSSTYANTGNTPGMPNGNVAYTNNNLYTSYQPEPQKDMDVMCLLGFIFTFVCSLLALNLISLVLCIIGVVNFDPTKKKGKGLGVAGIIINAVVMLTWIIVIVCLAMLGYSLSNYY